MSYQEGTTATNLQRLLMLMAVTLAQWWQWCGIRTRRTEHQREVAGVEDVLVAHTNQQMMDRLEP